MRVGMVLFPRFTQLDLTGPYEVFARIPGVEVRLIASTRAAVISDSGLALAPDATFDEVHDVDVVFVPGGPGVNDAMRDERLLRWLQHNAGARWITSVCTGSLVLGKAGLLRGYRATTHWLSHDLLPLVGAIAVDERVVVDRNRVTGGGVTAGIDFALTLAAELASPDEARKIQLLLEYAPAPPFDAGSPRTAPPAVVAALREGRRALQDERRRLLSEG